MFPCFHGSLENVLHRRDTYLGLYALLRPARRQLTYTNRKLAIGQPWTREEDAILTHLRSQHQSWEDILPSLPSRDTTAALQLRWGKIAPRDEHGRLLQPFVSRFSPEDDDRLRELRQKRMKYDVISPNMPSPKGTTALKDRYRTALQPRMKLGQESKGFQRWTPTEVARLLHLRGVKHMPWGQIAAELRRSARSVQSLYEARTRGRKDRPTVPRFGGWTSAEDEQLIRLWRQLLPDRSIAIHFPERTFSAVRQRLFTLRKKLGLKPRQRQHHQA
ncbi:hypothetical protein BDY17DRAFT_325705 [Neohortaea acidophila]|uniref:Myb-like domain-containing protein n=1 Tax=Neohortaea acidophila TaxID=245834 RepID=A0A6A6PLR9_9PEZI|nr:uncharacterized protein BDY17DRAFT_325705 [Neohortaea acidophila]KAF2480979.1 hypothetical protein BDY17DRAFT_325705 [Neohortaea acidophila]